MLPMLVVIICRYRWRQERYLRSLVFAKNSVLWHLLRCSSRVIKLYHRLCVLLPTGPNSRVRSSSGSTRNWTVATGLTTRKTQMNGNGPVSPPKTRHFKFTILAPIMYLRSDRIMTWSICTLCSFSRSFTSRCQICNRTNIRWVTFETARMTHTMWSDFTAIQLLLV